MRTGLSFDGIDINIYQMCGFLHPECSCREFCGLFFRAKERDRKKQNRKQAWEQNIELGPSRKTLKRNTMEYSECQLRVVVDCSFDNLMSERVR